MFKKYLSFCTNLARRVDDWRRPKKVRGFHDAIFTEIESQLQNKKKLLVLEVGCNDRPLITAEQRKKFNIELHGIDPDDRINESRVQDNFESFFITDLQSFETQLKYDIIILQTVLEHISDNTIAFKKFAELLKDSGAVLSYQPSSWHPFSILNRLIPHNLKVFILRRLRSNADVGTLTGWQSYYDKCEIGGFKQLSKSNDLLISDSFFYYNAAAYFAFFPPLYFLVVLYEEVIKVLNVERLAAGFWVKIEHKEKL